jgi:hypothetical protein
MNILLTRSLTLMMLSAFLLTASTTDAQILKRQLEKAGEKLVEKVIDKELKEDGDEPIFENRDKMSGNSGGEEDYGVRVKGKELTPPDPSEHIDNAQSALSSSNFSISRSEIRQALMAVEVALGQELLKSLPETVNGMDYLPDEDEVASVGIGFVGLLLRRAYKDGSRKMYMTISNNQTLLNQYNLIIANGAYVDDDGSYKTVTVQGHQGAITFDGDNQYDLGVPLGQNTVFMLECINFSDESQVMNSANDFEMDTIMKKLGDQ